MNKRLFRWNLEMKKERGGRVERKRKRVLDQEGGTGWIK